MSEQVPDQDEKIATSTKVACAVGFITVGPAAFAFAGLVPELAVLAPWQWFAIACGGGLLSGMIGSPNRLAGAISGTLAAAGVLGALWGYLMLRIFISNTFYRAELILPLFLGAVPGLIVHGVWTAKLRAEDSR